VGACSKTSRFAISRRIVDSSTVLGAGYCLPLRFAPLGRKPASRKLACPVGQMGSKLPKIPGSSQESGSSRSIICPMLYVWAINLIPAALIASAWFFHYAGPVTLPKSRQILFGCGLASSTLGAILLISFLMVNFVDPSHVGHVNEWGGRLWIAGSVAAILSFPLSCTGRGAQRVLALSSSLTIVVLLYVGGLATSI
jgi:hypothetical protein